MMHKSLIVAGTLLALAAVVPSRSASTARGVYTEAQASAGKQIYTIRCAMCHGQSLEGTFEIPALKGKFFANWGGRPVGNLFDYVSAAMPQMAPGSLSPDDNAKIVAYLLQQNGMPAGTTPLPASSEALKTIDFDPVLPTRK